MTNPDFLLEIGCEAGQNLQIIKNLKPKLHLEGCDISKQALAIASSQGFNTKLIDLSKRDSLNVYKDDEFDIVFLSHVLEHVLADSVTSTLLISCLLYTSPSPRD